MDASYVFEYDWRMEESAITDGRLYEAMKGSGCFDAKRIKPDPFTSWDDAREALKECIGFDLSDAIISVYPGYIEIKFEDEEVYLHDEVNDFLSKIAPFCKGYLCFESGLISELYRCTFIGGEIVYTSLYPQEDTFVVTDKSGKFVGTVSESFVKTIDKDKYIIQPVKLELNKED